MPLSSLALPTAGFIAHITRTNCRSVGGGGRGGGGRGGFHTFVCATLTLMQQTFKLHPTHTYHFLPSLFASMPSCLSALNHM